MRKQILSLQKAFATCLTDNGQAVERARADLANMGLTDNEALGHSQSNNSFLEKWTPAERSIPPFAQKSNKNSFYKLIHLL